MLTKSEAKNGGLLSFLKHHYQSPRTHSQPSQSKMVTEVLTTEKNLFQTTVNDE